MLPPLTVTQPRISPVAHASLQSTQSTHKKTAASADHAVSAIQFTEADFENYCSWEDESESNYFNDKIKPNQFEQTKESLPSAA